MSERFCEHLQEYGALYTRTLECETRCSELVARVLVAGPGEWDTEAAGALTSAVEAWLQMDRELRSALVELVHQGLVLLPKKKPHAIKRHGAPRCRECGRTIPRLELVDWNVAANGAVDFRGQELAGAAASAR